MRKQEVKAMPRNEVKTVFSERAITFLEFFVYWYWSNFTGLGTTDELMRMLGAYVKVNPQEEYGASAGMVRTISTIIQLTEQLNEMVEFETVRDLWGVV